MVTIRILENHRYSRICIASGESEAVHRFINFEQVEILATHRARNYRPVEEKSRFLGGGTGG